MNDTPEGAISQFRTALRVVWWVVRDPANAVMVAAAVVIGMVTVEEFELTMSLWDVRTGKTALSHQIAEGYK